MSELWTVHISGPDDVIEATDYADAVRLAHEINAGIVADLPNRTEFHPYAWATPCIQGRYAYPLTPEEMR